MNRAYRQFSNVPTLPPEGWLRTTRKALGMSGKQLAARLGVSKASVSKIELREPAGGVTLKSMHSAAQAMNCQFVYAVVPNNEVEALIREQATDKANVMIRLASTQMALEAQSLSGAEREAAVVRLAREIAQEMPADFWDRL